MGKRKTPQSAPAQGPQRRGPKKPRTTVPIINKDTEAPEVADDEVDSEVDINDMKFLADMDINAIAESSASLKERYSAEKRQANRENTEANNDKPQEDEEGEALSELESDDFALNNDDDSLPDIDSDLGDSDVGGDSVDGSDVGGDSVDGSDVGSDAGSDIDESDSGTGSDSGSDPEDYISENDVSESSHSGEPGSDDESPYSSEHESDLEREYENMVRRKPREEKQERLPIIVDGKAVADKSRPAVPKETKADEEEQDEDDEDSEKEEEDDEKDKAAKHPVSDPLAQRFGRQSIYSIFDEKSKEKRIARAQREIADLGRQAQALAENEGGLNVLRRLFALCQRHLEPPGGDVRIHVDIEIQMMALLSLTTVWADVLPSYRYRELTEQEKKAKVSQAVLLQREWEEGVLGLYGKSMKLCSNLSRSRSTGDGARRRLAQIAIFCLCKMAQEKPYFNFAPDILGAIVRILGSRQWDESCDRCLEAVQNVITNDVSSNASVSLHVVRLVARLVRARDFRIHPGVLSVLLYLRLSDELNDIRASTEHSVRDNPQQAAMAKQRSRPLGGKAKAKTDIKGSKRARAAEKEQQTIRKELEQAEGAIDAKERETNQTETLKLLFGLYFRIIKLEIISPLLPEALEGLARFAHLVNVDFFRDLLLVLRDVVGRAEQIRSKLLCMVTAFELLRGQGSSLNLDLSDFITAFYQILLDLALNPSLDDRVPTPVKGKRLPTQADLVFRALASIFHTPQARQSPVRILSFSKRLLTCSLQWSEKNQSRALQFVHSLMIKEPRLQGMVDPEDHTVNGRYLPFADQPDRAHPESTSWWELELLSKSCNLDVQRDAHAILHYKP